MDLEGILRGRGACEKECEKDTERREAQAWHQFTSESRIQRAEHSPQAVQHAIFFGKLRGDLVAGVQGGESAWLLHAIRLSPADAGGRPNWFPGSQWKKSRGWSRRRFQPPDIPATRSGLARPAQRAAWPVEGDSTCVPIVFDEPGFCKWQQASRVELRGERSFRSWAASIDCVAFVPFDSTSLPLTAASRPSICFQTNLSPRRI